MILNFRFLFFIFLIFSELWLFSVVLYVKHSFADMRM